MYIYELHESKTPKTPKPRNFVAKNATKSGAGAHRDKKKEQKQGYEKHKSSSVSEEAAGVGIVTKQNATADVPAGGEYMNVKKLFPKKKKVKETDVEEGLRDPKDNPCWKGYKPVGTKKKNGKTVPNCVPKESVAETATPGATSAGSIATVVSPHLAIGKANKSYTGSPGKSGTKAPKPPKVKMQKPGTNALDMKTNIFGEGNAIKR